MDLSMDLLYIIIKLHYYIIILKLYFSYIGGFQFFFKIPGYVVYIVLSKTVSNFVNHYYYFMSALGLPAVTVPLGCSNQLGLPLGIQFIGKWFDEATMMKVARTLELTIKS